MTWHHMTCHAMLWQELSWHDMSWACLGRVLGVSWACPGSVLGVSWTCVLLCVVGVSWKCPGACPGACPAHEVMIIIKSHMTRMCNDLTIHSHFPPLAQRTLPSSRCVLTSSSMTTMLLVIFHDSNPNRPLVGIILFWLSGEPSLITRSRSSNIAGWP